MVPLIRRLLLTVYIGLWLCVVCGHFLFGGTPPDMRWPGPVFLLLAMVLVFLYSPRDWKELAITAIAGFLAEVIGVATGFPFGEYSFTPTLGPSLWGVPLVMACAWMVLIAGVRQLQLPAWSGALTMVSIDLLIDPLAVTPLEFWRWKQGSGYYGIPFVNFAGWFAVSFILLLLVHRAPARNPATAAVGASIVLLFTLIGLAHGFWVPSSIGLMVCAAGYWRWRSSSVSTRI